MNISLTTWVLTMAVIAAIFLVDFLVIGRRPHAVSIREASVSVGVYVALAAVFGAVVWAMAGRQYATEFVAGYITELSLSVDNLFIFVVIMSAFAVPQVHQLRVLQLGIVAALVLRLIFILVGAVALQYFTWLFFIFGAFLVWTAWKLATGHGTEGDPRENPILRRVERVLPTTTEYHDGLMTVRLAGKRVFTPLAIVMVAIFVTDIMFALDSIPAIFGLTEEPYIVVTANAFALMGLRQMYFLLDGLLDRLIYLSVGLAVVLGFIGVKLILHAAHEYGLPAPEIGTPVSLVVIVATLTVTVVASLAKVRRHPEVYDTHDVTGHHHPEGAELDALRARGRHPDVEQARMDRAADRQEPAPDEP